MSVERKPLTNLSIFNSAMFCDCQCNGPEGSQGPTGDSFTGPTGSLGSTGESYTGPTGIQGESYTGATGAGHTGTSYTGPTGPLSSGTSYYGSLMSSGNVAAKLLSSVSPTGLYKTIPTANATVIQFSGTGTFKPSTNITGYYIVVGGGGGGGGNGGGGGGAGGLLTGYVTFEAGNTYVCTIGSGGAQQANGTSSTIIGANVSFTAIGGGYGGTRESKPVGADGGCGGGGSSYPSNYSGGTGSQGYNGGVGYNNVYASAGGGGGGYSANGGNASEYTGGTGGAGYYCPFSRSYFAGGGGGGQNGEGYPNPKGGSGVGGDGNTVSGGKGSDAVADTGSGGGGGGNVGEGGAGSNGAILIALTLDSMLSNWDTTLLNGVSYANSSLVVQESGNYFISSTSTSYGASTLGVEIRKNKLSFPTAIGTSAPANTPISISTIASLTAGDECSLYIHNSQGSANANTITTFSTLNIEGL